MEFPAFRSPEWIAQTFRITPLSTVQNSLLKTETINEVSQKNQNSPELNAVHLPSFWVPLQVLSGISLIPKWMSDFDGANIYKARRLGVQEEIRRALFRQALFKIQNIEVMHLKRCKQNRILFSIHSVKPSSTFKLFKQDNERFLKEEIWSVQRCNTVSKYKIRYYKEGDNGYSCSVTPSGIWDMIQQLRFNWMAPTTTEANNTPSSGY